MICFENEPSKIPSIITDVPTIVAPNLTQPLVGIDALKWIENKNDVEINAIGIGHDVTSYYSKALKIADVQELGDALIDQLADLFIEEPKRKKTIN